MTDRIIAEQSNGIGWLTLNNPHRHNAISLDMWQGLDEVLARFDAGPGIRVAVIRGAGSCAFASAADCWLRRVRISGSPPTTPSLGYPLRGSVSAMILTA